MAEDEHGIVGMRRVFGVKSMLVFVAILTQGRRGYLAHVL